MQQYLDFTLYPAIPGSQPRDTSEAAADSMRDSAPTLRAKALEVIRRRPSTADEVAYALDVTVLSARPRVTELFKMGLIEDSGDRRPNSSGRNAVVWRMK
jgi:predicted ArsR family transcriptional regulator